MQAAPKDVISQNYVADADDPRQDFFVQKEGVKCAGVHLLVDLWGADRLNDLAFIEQSLREAALAAEATILHCHLHHFEPNGGVTGVLVLAESHITIHTWPEAAYAALDVFMCGDCDPMKTIPVLEAAFKPDRLGVDEVHRGRHIKLVD